jgi:hypothetical protein
VCQLLPMQQGEALLLLLMAAEWRPSAEAHAALAFAAASPMQWLASAVAAELAAAQDGHVKGLRWDLAHWRCCHPSTSDQCRVPPDPGVWQHQPSDPNQTDLQN